MTSRNTGARDTLARFRAITERTVSPPVLESWTPPPTVLVTGGTGCVGSRVVRLLNAAGSSVVSLARRPPRPDRSVPGVMYLRADIRDRAAVRTVMLVVRPQTVIHCAAQRDPGQAERAVAETVSTNIGGTRVVLDAAGEAGVSAVSLASTGKTLRFHTLDVYAATKKVAEWMMADAAGRWGYQISASRFTHVVENSIVAGRIQTWLNNREPIQLHAPRILMYAQSATEAAETLLLGLRLSTSAASGAPLILALNNLEWPIDLDELASDMAREQGITSRIVYTGSPAGYEQSAFPGTYSLATANASPLMNALEVSLPGYQRHPAFPADLFVAPGRPDAAMITLAQSLAGTRWQQRGTPSRTRAQLSEFVGRQLRQTAQLAPRERVAAVLETAHGRDLSSHTHFTATRDILRSALRTTAVSR